MIFFSFISVYFGFVNLALRLLKPWYVMNMWHFVITCVYVSLYWLIFFQAFCKILMQKGILKKPIFFLNAMIIDTKMVFQKSMINWKVVFIENYYYSFISYHVLPKKSVWSISLWNILFQKWLGKRSPKKLYKRTTNV